MKQRFHNTVECLSNQGWDQRITVCRCALIDGSTVDHHIIVTKRYVILIDTALNPETAELLLHYVSLQLTERRQLLIINTHADWDHAWGNQIFAGADAICPAPIIASRACAARLQSTEAVGVLDRFRRDYPPFFNTVRLTPPTILFDEQLAINGGDLTLQLFATPGHTPDHISVYIPEINILFPGDAAEVPFPFVDSAAAIPAIRASLHRLADCGATTVLPCHAPVTSGPQVIQDNIGYFDALEHQCRAALARGIGAELLPEEDAAAIVGFPLAAALPAGVTVEETANMYRQGHQEAVRAMLLYLGQGVSC